MAFFLALSVLSLARFALAFPSVAAVNAACDSGLPVWTVKNLTVGYGAEVADGGKASWTFINNKSGASENLACSLRANSRCETDDHAGAHIFLQISIDTVYWTVNQTWSCDSPKTTYVLGVAEMELDCPDSDLPESQIKCTTDSGTITAALPDLAP